MSNSRFTHIIMVIALFTPFHLANAGAVGRGGSNYVSYNINQSTCDVTPFGVIKGYSGVNAFTINSQLQGMFNNGQRKLRLPIFHSRDLSEITLVQNSLLN